MTSNLGSRSFDQNAVGFNADNADQAKERQARLGTSNQAILPSRIFEQN